MNEVARSFRWLSYRTVVGLLLGCGLVMSLLSYRYGQLAEEARATAEFEHRATLRLALIREIFGHYEDALFGLSALFVSSETVDLEEFTAATRRIAKRLAGVQAFEWVPRVSHAERPAFEARLTRAYGRRVEITEFPPGGVPARAPDRGAYYPIAFVEPLAGNETALGLDVSRGATNDSLTRARESGEMVVSQQVRLVQDIGDQFGIVMVLPVFRSAPAGFASGRANGGTLSGFLQCVFRTPALLELTHSRQPDTILEMLFIDGSETDPAKRVLYHRPSNLGAGPAAVSEADFQSGLHRAMPIPFGGRDWRVIFRPRPGWLEQQGTAMPLLRSLSLLFMSALVAGIVYLLGRRTDIIGREVELRTAELAESRRQISSVLHALPGMAYRCTYDDNLSVVFVSEGALKLTGWSAQEIMSGAVHFRDLIHPDDVPRVRDLTRTALQDRGDVEVEYRIRARNGEEKWVLSRARGVYDAGDALRFLEGLAIDITAQKNAETARLTLERKLLESQKLESLGLLAGGIAHDFNNLLSTILGNASLARLSLPAGTGSDGQLEAIETAALRAAELCRQMLAYAGKGRFVIEPTDVTALAEELLPLLKISVGHQAALRLELARNLPPVMADATQLRQIVMNLVLNAADAVAGGAGEVVVASGQIQADAELLAACVAGAGLPTGNYVFIEVRDNGVGMTPEVAAKIFDPFFTTKFAGRGLGLAAVLGIVRGHNGALQVQSTPGEGSMFRLLLPPSAGPSAVRCPDTAASPRWARNETVLVIEDEEPVRFVTSEILKSYGLTTLVAANGSEGLEIFRREADRIDLVLLDVLMPGLSGEQVMAQLRALRPDVRVLLMSGYTDDDVIARLRERGGRVAFIPKPFTRSALEQALRALLD